MRQTDYSDPGFVLAPLSGRWQVLARRTLLGAIAVAALGFFVWQWLLAPVSASNPSAPLAATPALVYSSEDTPDEIDLGESFELEISVAEYSGQGDRGGISVSFPGLTATGGNSSSYDSGQGTVTTISYTNGSSHVAYFDEGDQIFKGNDANRSSAEYLLVESDDGNWPSGTGGVYEWRILKLRVTPKQTGEFEVYYRVWLCGDGYQECDRRPRSENSDQEDQQRWAVNVITVDVTNPVSQTGDFARDQDEDFDTLDAAENEGPVGIWSDGTTMWVADYSDDKIYAYNLATKARDSAKDFNTLDTAENEGPAGIWSDGTTMWVADYSDDKIYAYNLATKARDSAKDFDTLEDAENEGPEGIWSDGTTMWVADRSDDKIYAYNLATKARDSAKDFNTLEDAENESPSGIWSDGATMWVADSSDDKIYAYNLSTKARDSAKDFDTLEDADNESPEGIWSDRTTMWVADSSDDKIYAYNAPEMAPAPVISDLAPSVSKVTPTSASVSLFVLNSQTFEASASDPDDDLTSWDWSVNGTSEDDGRFGFWPFYNSPTGTVTKEFTHTFSSSGDYTVEATFTDKGGRSGSVTWTVEVTNRAPVISSATPPPSSTVSLTMGDSQTFEATVSDPDNNLKSWDWSVDGASEDSGTWGTLFSSTPTGSVTKSFSHTFSTAGSYTVKATFTDTEGDSDSEEWTVQVDESSSAPSVSKVTPTSASVSLFVLNSQTFEASASDPDDDLTSWDWSVNGTSEDDGRFGFWPFYNSPTGTVTKEFTHTFSSSGDYTVEATFTDKGGRSGSVTWTVEVTNRAPVISSVTPPPSSTVSLTTGDSQTFEATVSDPDDNLKSWDWSVDGASEDSGTWGTLFSSTPDGSVTKSLSHTFSTAGSHTVKATFTDTEGDSDSEEWTVQVDESSSAPSVSLGTPSSASVSLYVLNSQTFEASASDPDDDLTSWDWSVNGASEDSGRFGIWPVYNSPTGTVTKEFTHTFSSAGTYTVEATFTDKGGRSGSATWTVEVTNRAPVISSATPPPSSAVSLTMGDSQTFEATVSDPDNNLKSWDWSVDGASEDSGTWGTLFSSTPDGSVTKSFSHTFSTAGSYTVKATFTDTESESASEEWTVEVSSTSGTTPRAEITSCGSDPAIPSVGQGWTPVAEVTNHSYTGNLLTKFYVQFTISDPTRDLALPEVESAKVAVEVGDSHTFRGELVESWPDDDKEQRVKDGSHQLSLYPLKWFPGQIDVKCELKAEDHLLRDVLVDEDTGKVTVPDFQRNSADAKMEMPTCAPARQPVLSGEEPTFHATTTYLGHNKGLTRFAVEYWVHYKELRVHHSGDDVKPDSMLPNQRNSSSGWRTEETEEWERPENWIDLNSQNLPTGTYALDCALWGHLVSPAYKRLSPGNRLFDALVSLVDCSNPFSCLEGLIMEEDWSPSAEVQLLEREISKWISTTTDYSLQGLVSTEFSVVEARWGTAGLGIERETEMLLEGRERIRVRVIREETEDRVGGRIPAPYFHVNGPEVVQTKEATRCGEGDQDHGKYLTLCWETTFDIPVNDTINEREYSVRVESHFIEDDQTNGFTVEVSPDAAGLRALYDATGGPNWVDKTGWLSNDPIGDWYGVDTDASGRVVKLDLRGSGQRGNGLQGPLPSDLKDALPFLLTLYLGGNSGLTECVREDLLHVQFNDLKSLDLPTCEDTCAWGEALPDPNNQGLVADCEALLAARDTLTAGHQSERLNWSAREPIGTWRGVVREGNPERVIKLEIESPPRLWGYISGELAKLSNLQVLNLPNAGLQGKIPEELKNLASLHTLNLQGNQLTGGIPQELSGLTSLQTLDLSENDLNRPIPGKLTALVNLQTLRLGGNRFSGCIPEGLRGVANNDLGDLGLPFCDVLLSGLTISPGVLTPTFASGRTYYTAEVGVSRITVTPANSHNATFKFLDENNAPIPDADNILEGHQVELGNGVTTIGVKVVSQDAGASHTYTIQVSRGGGLPDAPAIVVPITSGAASLTVSWTAPPGETGITSYDLRYIESGSQPDANWTVMESVWTSGSGSLNYQITGLTNGTQYDVQVRTVNATGHGFWSAVATGTPRATPGAPAIDSLGPGDSTLAVEWSAPATDGGADSTGYDLRYIRSDAPDKTDANWTSRSSIWSSGALRYDLRGLTNGVSYDVQVRAANTAGHGQWSASMAATPDVMPTAPATVSVAADDGTLTIAWTAPTDTGGLNIQSYDVRYIPADENNPGATWTEEQGVGTPGRLEHTIIGLTNGVRYDLELRAVTSTVDGPWSSTFSGTPRTTPGAPIISLATPDGSTLTVAWDAPANTGGSAITSYDLRHIQTSADATVDANWTVVDNAWTIGSGALSYTITDLTGGTQYDVQVRSVNAAGDGPWSATATATPANWGATRSFSPPSVSPGGQVVVTITATGYGSFGAVTETLPPGFDYLPSSLSADGVTIMGREVTFLLQGETSFTYKVTAPDTAGSNFFSGVLINEDKHEVPVSGALNLMVGALPGVNMSYAAGSEDASVRLGSPISLTATFSEPIIGFTVDDIIVANGTADNFAGSDGDTVYTFDVKPNAIGEVTVDIVAGVAEDADGNSNTAAAPLSLGMPYDDDGDGAFSKGEVITVIGDYLFGDLLTKGQVIEIIGLYLFG